MKASQKMVKEERNWSKALGVLLFASALVASYCLVMMAVYAVTYCVQQLGYNPADPESPEFARNWNMYWFLAKTRAVGLHSYVLAIFCLGLLRWGDRPAYVWRLGLGTTAVLIILALYRAAPHFAYAWTDILVAVLVTPAWALWRPISKAATA